VIAQDILTLKNGQTYEGTLDKITDTYIYFKAKEMKSVQGIPLKVVKSVHDKNGEILFSGDDSSLADIILKEEENKIEKKRFIVSHPPIFYFGAFMIAGSGALGLYLLNRECENCNIDEIIKFNMDTERLNHLQYLMLLIGGICIWADELIIEQ
tara:strand:- start:38 stop:499 length:462 start_codon:yes stop_codon:yes gene_type:complete